MVDCSSRTLLLIYARMELGHFQHFLLGIHQGCAGQYGGDEDRPGGEKNRGIVA